MSISAEDVKNLREKTGAGMMDCKNALKESGGDAAKATEILRKKGLDKANKKAGRTTKEGRIGSYIHHGGKVGVLVEIDCETDFVAKNEDFKVFMKEVAMQIAAAHPLYVTREEVPGTLIEKEKEIIKEQIKDKPEQVQEKIISGKLEKFYEDICLMDQKFIKDDKKSVKALLGELVGKIGENIVVKRFSRFVVGEEG